MKILIVDRNAVVRAGMRLILKDFGEMIVFDDASGICDARQAIQKNECEVALIGLSLPDLEGFKILEMIRRDRPSLPVILVGMHADEQLAVKAYVLGADGFVEADRAEDDLIRAIERVVKGGKYASEKIMEAVVVRLRGISGNKQASPCLKQLSGRERQIAELLVSGVTNKEIAWKLAINVKTVSTHKTRILSKLNLKNLAELVKYQLSYATSC